MPINIGVGALLLASACCVWWVWRYNTKTAALPPGPPGLPLVGNIFDVPLSQAHKTFRQWGDKYGNIIHFRAFGQPYIVVNDLGIANDLLEKKSAIYSDRPSMCMAGELVGWNSALALQPYGQPRFKEFRKHFFRLFGTHANVARYSDLLEHEGVVMIKEMLVKPEVFSDNLRKFVGAIMLQIAYGYHVQGEQDPIVETVELAMKNFAEVFGKLDGYLVDYVPLLKFLPESFPGTRFKKVAKEYAATFQAMAQLPFDYVQKCIEEKTAEPCFVTEILGSEVRTAEELDTIKWSAASIYAGGADTTVSLLQTFFLVMTLFPDIQKKAQAEIDHVVGPDRLPRLSDRTSLPFVNALLSECLRWGSVAPIALPHRVTENDFYNGYLIPKGSIVLANIWNMLHDPDAYHNPDVFDPDRFIETLERAPERDPRTIVFGFGRRICPGLHLADETGWIQMVLCLATLDISKAVDESGAEITPLPHYIDGGITRPVPFKCTIRPRSEQAKKLVLDA